MKRRKNNKSAPSPQPSTPTPEASSEQSPAEQKEVALREAWATRHLHLPNALTRMIGERSLGTLGSKAYFNTVLGEAGDPADPVERMMVEQLLLAHHRLAHLYTQADLAQTPEFARVLHGAANRLLGEFRRLALALRIYRQPPSSRSFSVVHQQNVVAGGSQRVEYVDQSSPAGTEVSFKAQDRGELVGNRGSEADHEDRSIGGEESAARDRWAAQRLQAAAVE